LCSFGGAGFQDGAVGAAVAVEGRDGGHAAAASIGKNKIAKGRRGEPARFVVIGKVY